MLPKHLDNGKKMPPLRCNASLAPLSDKFATAPYSKMILD